ncbi:MAG: tripartite tricarboxylate transporter substrate binding protein [Betaproteobacteria bacterium]|nr:tripartite tricarboxylate transporter substrate binding protein [Betaproteobacteria bacterium]
MSNQTKAAVASICLLLSGWAQAQYPDKPIRIVVPFVAGGVSDNVARQVALKITEQTGKTFVVENRGGAGGRIGYETGAKAAPDGYTITATDATYTMLPGIFGNKLTWAHSDLTPVLLIAQMPFVIVTRSGGKIRTLLDLVAQAKANPQKLNYGSSGNGGVNHLVTELFSRSAGVSMQQIPYKGMGDAVVGLLGEQVDVLVTAMPTGLPHVISGKMTALAVSSAKRAAAAPNIPTASEQGVPFVSNNWVGFTVPKGSPREAYDWLSKSVLAAMATPELQQRIHAMGAEPKLLVGDDYGRMMRSETARWTDVVKAAGIKVE